MGAMQSFVSQSFRIPSPSLTESNLPDQKGKVFIVTGGYAGCGQELAQILYGANGTVYVAGRSQEKADKAIATIKAGAPKSGGKIEFMKLDLSDLKTIKPAVEEFLAKEGRLDVLTNNAGVMVPPEGSVDAQGVELQMGTNVLGPFLLTKLLYPTIVETAKKSTKDTVRVTWAASLAVDLLSPKHGVTFGEDGKPKVLGKQGDYGQSKASNSLLANEWHKRHGKDDGVVHVSWNPGNLKTELQRHTSSIENAIISFILYPAKFGAYTELWAGWAPELTLAQGGSFVAPWGRVMGVRADVQNSMKSKSEGGSGVGAQLWDWCEESTKQFA